jgi:hypothetical protein
LKTKKPKNRLAILAFFEHLPHPRINHKVIESSIKTKENKDHERKRVILLLLLFSIQQGLSNDISIQFAAQITRCP